jgi:hypothetical protein
LRFERPHLGAATRCLLRFSVASSLLTKNEA